MSEPAPAVLSGVDSGAPKDPIDEDVFPDHGASPNAASTAVGRDVRGSAADGSTPAPTAAAGTTPAPTELVRTDKLAEQARDFRDYLQRTPASEIRISRRQLSRVVQFDASGRKELVGLGVSTTQLYSKLEI